MKKIVTLIALLLAATVTLSAANTVELLNKKHVKETIDIKSRTNKKTNQKAAPRPFPTGEYKSLGFGYMTDDMVCPLYSLQPVTYQVEIQQSEEDPNFYRVIAPYGTNFAAEVNKQLSTPLTDAEYDKEGTCFIDIDATDPEDVYFGKTMIGCNWGDGEMYIGISTSGTVTFKDLKFAATINGLAVGDDSGAVAANRNGKFRITLPGAKLDDYELKLTPETQCLTDKTFKASITVGSDIATVKCAVVQDMQEDEMTKYVTAISEIDNVLNIRGSFSYQMAEEVKKETLIVVGLNSENTIVGYDWVTYYFVDQSDEDWVTIGTATWNDAALSSIYNVSNESLTCEMQRNTLRPTYYRLINPFQNATYAQDRYYHKDHKHYIYLAADDPELIYIEESPIGLNFGQGLVRYTSSVSYYVQAGFDPEECKELELGAIYEDGKLTFGDEAILISALGYENGDWLITEGGTELILPEGVDLSGVQEVIADSNVNAKTELFNLQGIKVTNPQEGQLYIKRQGSKASKIVF